MWLSLGWDRSVLSGGGCWELERQRFATQPDQPHFTLGVPAGGGWCVWGDTDMKLLPISGSCVSLLSDLKPESCSELCRSEG